MLLFFTAGTFVPADWNARRCCGRLFSASGRGFVGVRAVSRA